MAKLPKMNLFVDSFNSDTVYLSEEELGLYMRMIFYAWTHNAYLPKDKEIIYCLPKKPNDALNKFNATVKYANNFILSPT